MRFLSACLLLGAIALAACNSGEPGRPPAPVVVYASAEQEQGLLEAFAAFSAETRIPVTLKVADSAANTDRVIRNEGTPAADVLITSGVSEIWRAGDEGALRPLTSSAFAALPSVLKDPDRMWAAIGVRYAMIGAAPGATDTTVQDYSDLARSELRGKVCLTSSELPANRALIAMLVEDMGVKPAERMVRAWVRNLAASPYATQSQLFDALRTGSCQYAIVSVQGDAEAFSRISPSPLYLDIDAIGIARHAGQAESAQTLVEWMLKSNPVGEPELSNGKNIGLAGWRGEEARLLVERAGYR